jgi:hypothetical protein
MGPNRRKAVRRTIGYGAKIVANDGSWQRDCRVLDISQTGAKIAIDRAAALPRDFILALSAKGSAMRRCEVVWVLGGQLGVRFERPSASGR